MRSKRAIEGFSRPAACQSLSVTSKGPERRTEVMRQIITSEVKSKSTSDGRILLTTPEVNGNWQRKTSPNMLTVGIVNGIFWRVLAQELLVRCLSPFGILGIVIRQHEDARSPHFGQSGRNFGGNFKYVRVV